MKQKSVDYLLEEKVNPSLEDESEKDLDPLVIKIMSEKLNEKYSGKFNKDQREILKSYAFASLDESQETNKKLKNLMQEISKKSIGSIETLRATTDNKTIMEKISTVKEKIMQESEREINDQKVVRFLTLIDMCKEIKESV